MVSFSCLVLETQIAPVTRGTFTLQLSSLSRSFHFLKLRKKSAPKSRILTRHWPASSTKNGRKASYVITDCITISCSFILCTIVSCDVEGTWRRTLVEVMGKAFVATGNPK